MIAYSIAAEPDWSARNDLIRDPLKLHPVERQAQLNL
jgi:hypothetical protein